MLDRAAAEQVLAHVAADLNRMFPDISRCSLSMAGALYDQTQLMRPGLAIFDALTTLQQSGNPGGEFHARLLSVGASDGQMPMQALQPFDQIPLGLLQLLPILVSGPAELVNELNEKMEHRFLEQGQLSAHSAKALESQFGVSVQHARFMTFTDLNALLRLQLEHFGFLPLWELLDAAITRPSGSLKVNTAAGHQFEWRDGAVHCYFESFDWWAAHGCGADVEAADGQLQAAYADWTREYRRYTVTLQAHGVQLKQHLPGIDGSTLTDSFLLEESTLAAGPSPAPITEHSTDDLGIIAVTVVNGDRQLNLYPLQANGLDDLHQFIREQGLSGDIAYPGCITYNEDLRQLTAEPLPGTP